MIDSSAISSQTPAQASQSDNVRKCPVLSGPPVLIGFTTASIYSLMTYRHNPSCTDRTSIESSPLPSSCPPSRSPWPSPSRCRSSASPGVATDSSCCFVPSCLRGEKENQKVTRPTPTQASQSNNVRKCPVLSGPTDLPGQIDVSPDSQTTCAQNPSRPDRTSTGNPPWIAQQVGRGVLARLPLPGPRRPTWIASRTHPASRPLSVEHVSEVLLSCVGTEVSSPGTSATHSTRSPRSLGLQSTPLVAILISMLWEPQTTRFSRSLAPSGRVGHVPRGGSTQLFQATRRL